MKASTVTWNHDNFCSFISLGGDALESPNPDSETISASS